MSDELLSAAQAAALVGVSRELIARYCRRGDIPAQQVGAKGAMWAIRRSDLLKWRRPKRGRPPKKK